MSDLWSVFPPGARFQPGSALARPLDLRLASNRFAVLGAVAVLLGARGLGRPWRESLEAGGTAFLAWSTARELDPDHPGSAATALSLAALPALTGGSGHIWTGVGVLSGLRLLAGTVGRDPQPVDLAALGLQAALASASGERIAGLLPALSSGLIPGPSLPWGAAGLLVPGQQRGAGTSLVSALLALGALAVAFPLTAPEAVQARCDHPPRTIQARRVQRARQAAVLTLLGGLVSGQSRSLIPLAAAALAVGWRRQG
ncbi:hypothetical protein [Deinococcus navajonensis]|uniref:Uncharacterized protein n=1 Tax=Deinococcus navajonensis TaxID=309884 RepID=A0ABV8XKA7_9DEIO